MKDYDVEEGFVYDYKKDEWYKIHTDKNEATSHSNVLKLDLASFLR
jgi:hypothetical protein